MARPPKLSTEEMVKIVDSFFESNGNPGMLKCSHLEVYAASLGVNAKAYDFRRNESVRQRINELRNSIKIDGHPAIVYKSLAIDAMLNRNRTKEMLRNSLVELDEYWRQIYERAADLSEKNRSLLNDIFSKKQNIEALAAEKCTLETENKSIKATSHNLLLENRYLKKILKQYLYPAVANEILKNENVLEQIDTEVTQEAMDKLTDPNIPAPFSTSVAADRETVSREESLLNRMQNQIRGEL